MANTIPSPNMNLPIPVTGVDPGPDWANNLNACLQVLDGHNHASGSGVQINPAGININTDLPFNLNNATLLRSVRFSPQLAVLVLPTDLGCLYEVGVDLYYNDGSGNNIRITQSGGVAGTPGSITGLVPPASATYVAGNQTFVWQSAALTPANLDAGSVIIRKILSGSNGIKISAPLGLSADYEIFLPVALPLAQKIVTLDASGNLAASWDVDNVTLEVVANNLQVKNQSVTQAKLALRVITINGSNPGVGGISISSSSGVAFTTSAVFVPITNMSCTITTLGRPVNIDVISDGTANPSFWEIITTGGTGRIRILRDATEIAQHYFNVPTSGTWQWPSSLLSHIDVPAAGTYVYSMEYNTAGPTQVGLNYSKMVVSED